MTTSVQSNVKKLVHEDYLSCICSHAIISINYQEIIDDYDAETWEILKQNILAQGLDYYWEKDGRVYLGSDCDDMVHQIIGEHWTFTLEEWDFVEKSDW